jgi:hypothetical protein
MPTRHLYVLILFIVAAAFMRLVPHPANFVPITAIALFGGAYLPDRRMAYLVPLGALVLSDLWLGFHAQMWLVYVCFTAVVWIGTRLQGYRGVLPVAGATVASSVLFYLVTNLGVWAFAGLYPPTLEGLLVCYVAAIPFFHNALLGDLFYVGLLFGGFSLLERRMSQVRGAGARPA